MYAIFSLGPVFVAIAVIFLALAVQDFLKAEGKLTPARKTWLRVALIFACVAIALFIFHSFNLLGQ
jgi:hypothetical protein